MKQVSVLSKNYSYLQFMPGENIARIHPPNCLLSNCSEKIPEFKSSKNIIWPAFLAFWPTVRCAYNTLSIYSRKTQMYLNAPSDF